VNKKAFGILVILLALLASACTFQFSTTVNEDGTGKFVTEFGLTTDEISQLESFGGESFDDLCSEDEFAADGPEGATVVQEERGDEIWCVATLPFNDLSGLEEAYRDMDVQINTLSMTEDEFVYDVTFDMGGGEGDLSALTAMGVELSMNWQVVTPGRVIEHNADQVDGDVLTWNLDPTGTANLQVRSNVGGGGFNLLLIVGIVVALVVIAGAIFMLTRRKPEVPQEPQPPVA
jgi:hypothetical protein